MRTVSHLFLGLALTGSLQVHGLGFGEVSVYSGLGQPFSGHIQLLDTPTDISSDCFKLRPVENSALPLPPGIRLEIERLPDRQARLKLSSSQPVNDPVLGFVARVICEVHLEREYALLLDPVAVSEPVVEVVSMTVPAMGTAVQENRREAPSRPTVSRQTAAIADAVVTRVAPAPLENKVPRRQSAIPKSRLILSHGSSPPIGKTGGKPGESSLQTSRPPTLEELADDNTALNLKLAHLEQQLSALQKRHADLVARSGIKAAAEPEEAVSHAWIYFLFGSLALIPAAAWLLHLQNRQKPEPLVEAEPDIQHIRRAHATPPSSGVSLEVLPAIHEEMPQAQADAEFPEHAPEKPVIHDRLEDNVEVFVAHGQSALAIHLLEDHVRQHPKASLAPWLLWLDLLQRAEDPAKYEEVRQHCRRHFNVIIPAYAAYQDYSPVTEIESYRHVMAELVRLWPTGKIAAYLDALLYDNRGGNRIGFDSGAYYELTLLRAICDATSIP